MAIHIVLLRAIGPLTHKLMSMGQWREACERAGLDRPETILATGNMIVGYDGSGAKLQRLMTTIVRDFGLTSAVMVVPPRRMATVLAADPFPDASAERPSQMGVYFFSTARPDFSWIGDHDGHERLAAVGSTLIVDYSGGVSDSLKLPGIIEKRSGVATARNWNTLRKLVERAAARRKEA
jgi:uncharacterized protein (DUF1697 family)